MFDMVTGVVLAVGTPLPSLLQVYIVYRAKTVKGLSYYTLALGNVAQLNILLNAIILKWPQLQSCRGVRVEAGPQLTTLGLPGVSAVAAGLLPDLFAVDS